MNPEHFRHWGHQAVDWMADYLNSNRDWPVLPRIRPGELIDALPASGPDHGEAMETIFEDFRNLVVPSLTHWNHPRFFAYFANSATGPGILGEMLAAALNANAMLWKTAPAATELEQVTLGWLREWLGLPEGFFGIIHDTASTSTMHAVAAAREMIAPDVRVSGDSSRLVLYTSEHANLSVEKAALAIGIGRNNIRKIPVDTEFRLRVDALRDRVEADLAKGQKPFCIVPTVGTTSTASIDPVAAVVDLAQNHGVWVHVDAAYGGAAAVVPEFQNVLDGVSGAHSVVVNPHKWLLAPMDVSVLLTRAPAVFKRTFSLTPEYLRTADDPRAINFSEFGVPLGRRFRALKLWFIFRCYGREGIAQTIRNHMEWARRLGACIRKHPDFEVVAPIQFSLVCFRRKGTDERNRELLEAVNTSGKAFLSHTVLDGRYVLRLAIGNAGTTWEDVEQTWELIQNS